MACWKGINAMEETNQAWPDTLRGEMGKRKDLKLCVQVCPHSESDTGANTWKR